MEHPAVDSVVTVEAWTERATVVRCLGCPVSRSPVLSGPNFLDTFLGDSLAGTSLETEETVEVPDTGHPDVTAGLMEI